MTKKDYQALAGAIYKARERAFAALGTADNRAAVGVIGIMTDELSRVLKADNPRFNRECFLLACEDGNVSRRPKRVAQ